MVSEHDIWLSTWEFHGIEKEAEKVEVFNGGRIEFFHTSLRSMHDLPMEIKEIRRERKNETSRGFQNGEGMSTSYQQYKQPMLQKVPQCPTMPTFLAKGNE